MAMGGKTTAESLRNSVINSLKRADERSLTTVALPAIGTGIAGFPLERCATVMIEEVKKHLDTDTSVMAVTFVLFGDEAFNTFKRVYEQLPKN